MRKLEDYIEDPRFVSWALENDSSASTYFHEYMESNPAERASLLKAREQLMLLAVNQKPVSQQRKMNIYQTITAHEPLKQTGKTRQLLQRFMPYAAIALVFFALGSLVMNLSQQGPSYSVPEQLLVKGAAQNTTIYMADGSKKEVSDSNQLIDFSSTGRLVLGEDIFQLNPKVAADAVNMVVVPYGKRAFLRLPDHSQVQLSAGSRILIPQDYSSESRSAYLLGEAFFDISKDPQHPFLLHTLLTEIKVLGTSFRVQAYADLPEQKTFLREGKVLIRELDHSIIEGWTEMKPNQEAVTSGAGGKTQLKNGDPKAYDLWKDGILEIKEQPLSEVVSRVEHYFNITIHIPDAQIQNRVMSGKLNLDADLPKVFEYLENITDGKIINVSAGEYELN